MRHFSKSLHIFFASLTLTAASVGAPARANENLDLWGAVVFLCGWPIPKQPWGDEACAIVLSAAEAQAQELNLPLAAVDAGKAGLGGGPESGAPAFDWGKALRMLVKFEKTESQSYPWSMTVLFYDHPADASGQRIDSNFRIVYQQSATFAEGDELKNTREVTPVLVDGILDDFFKEK